MSSNWSLIQGNTVELENQLWAPGLGPGEKRGSENDSSVFTPREGGKRPVDPCGVQPTDLPGPSSQSYGFLPVVMYRCESWSIKKAECQRIDAFELWCWRRLLRVPWTARRSNESILKEINPKYSLKD